jgi:mediator of RNA polymerase II transcription subunit 5
MDPSQVWVKFLDGCLQRRLRAEQFDRFAIELYQRSPIMERKLADILLSRQELLNAMVDPLLSVYAGCLLESNRLSSADLLGALFRRSSNYVTATGSNNDVSTPQSKQARNPAELEHTILDQLTRLYIPGGKRPKTQQETRVALRILAEWMATMSTSGDALLQSLDQQAIIICDSLGMLATAMLENPKVIGVIDTALPKGTGFPFCSNLYTHHSLIFVDCV